MTKVLNKHGVINPDATVFTRRTSTAATCTARGANYQKAPTFGEAVGVNSYQTPRAYSFARGIRF